MPTQLIHRFVLSLLLCLSGCARDDSLRTEVDAPTSDQIPVAVNRSHLPNAFRLHQKIISGGQPDGEAGYRQLRDLGVRTIISVDGAQPDTALATRYGLRYVHLPHGYDGIPERRARELAKAARDLPGPIYIHCHHGKHRSPAAATVACVGAGLLESDLATRVLKTAGTSERYLGLYESAETARRFNDALLNALEAEFPETVDVPPMAEAMVRIERIHDQLELFAAHDWGPLAEHPDLDPAHETLQLREQFTELLRTDEVLAKPPEFVELLRESENAAEILESALQNATEAPTSNSAISESMTRISTNCTACHSRFRDVPLSEKRRP